MHKKHFFVLDLEKLLEEALRKDRKVRVIWGHKPREGMASLTLLAIDALYLGSQH